MKVLLAEDGVVNAQFAIAVIKSLDHEFDLVDDGFDALEKWEEGEHDILLASTSLPELSGLDVVRKIREQETDSTNKTHLALIVTNDVGESMDEAINVGADVVITRPINEAKLKSAIDSLKSISSNNAVSNSIQPTSPHRFNPADHAHAPYDKAEAMKNLGGCEQIFVETAELFFSECDTQFKTIEEGIRSGDCEAVMRAAHTLKSSAALFAAEPARDSARQLEHLGRDRTTSEFQPAYSQLRMEVDKLTSYLRDSIRASTISHSGRDQ